MPLHKIKDFDPDYSKHFDDNIIGLDLYDADEKIGSIEDILVDDEGNFRYFVIHTGAWILGKRTLLPIGRLRVDDRVRRAYVDGLTRAQIENLPEYDGLNTVDAEREELTRQVYRSADVATPVATPDTYEYHQDADLYDLDRAERQTIKLYQERLIADKVRRKTGEVSIGKHVETKTATVSIPIEKERVVIERTPGSGATVAPSEANFQTGEVARMEIYEETPAVRKEAFIREEVSIHKEIDRETVEASEQIRREELDIDKEGTPLIERDTVAKKS